jgi:hypothetical protein
MPVKIINRNYEEIFTNGTTDWLLGNVGEWQTLNLKVEASVDYIATQEQPLQIDYINRSFTLLNGKNWGDYGFDNGMSVILKYLYSQDTNNDGTFETVTPYVQTYTITNVYGSTMEVAQAINVQSFDNIPTNFGNKKISEVKIYVDKMPEGLRFKYSHLTNENFQSTNLNSLIDGTISEFVKPNILNNGTFQQMEAVGLQSGMSIRMIEVKPYGKKNGTDNVYEYDIKIQYMISSLFEDLSNFENMEMPSYLTGDGSLTDNFSIEFYPEWNNPNVKIKNNLKQTERLGNTGWFDENFNQLSNDFKIDSVQYFDVNGNQVDAMDYATETKVKIVVSGVPNLNSQTECGFGFAWIPSNESDYKNKETPLYRNLFVQSGSLTNGFTLNTLFPAVNFGAGIDGASMDSSTVKFTGINGKIVMEANFIPNPAFFALFDKKDPSDRNFILWVSVADGSLGRNFSDRVSLLADFNSLVKNIPPAGEYPYIDAKFIEHPFDETNVGETMLDGLVQDDILMRIPFRIKKDKTVVFQKIEFGVEAFNIGLNDDFVLEKYEIDLTQFPTDSAGTQQFDFDQSRGFKLEPGNNKNWVKVKREPLLDTVDFYGYMAYFATKIRYEDWLLNQSTPPAFFNANATNNGFNNDWINYIRTNGWIVNFYAKIDAVVNGDLLQYKNQFKMKFVDYDENQNIDTTHQYFRDSDDTLLNVGTDPESGKPLGVILSNEPTRIEISFDILDDGVWDIDKTYAVTTIEIDKGAGRMEMRQLSSVWGSETDNPLIPLTGETKLKMEVDVTNKVLKTSCLVDPDLLQPGAKYRITGRVGCKVDGNGTGEIFDPGLYEFRYETTYE